MLEIIKRMKPEGVYELVVGKQPTVGAGLPRPAPMYRPVAPLPSSKQRPVNRRWAPGLTLLIQHQQALSQEDQLP